MNDIKEMCMFMKYATAVGTLAMLAGASQADLITYEYTGTVSNNTFWSFIRGQDVTVQITVDTSVDASSLTGTRAQYDGAVVGGFFAAGEYRWDINPEGTRNSVVVVTDVFDQNFGTFSNRYGINVSVFDSVQGPFVFPGNISLNLTDNDSPRDTVTNLDMAQPLDTMRTISNGGVDQFSVGLGIINGVAATLLSGDGGIAIVPAPAGLAAFGLLGLGAARRRRAG